jgi:NitT/TauT family transport system substrate-binding protein
MRSIKRRSLLSALLTLSAAAFGLVACEDKPKPAGGNPSGSATAMSGNTGTSESTAAPPPASGREYQIAWSVWTGWMPFKLMQEKGFLAARAKENSVNIKLVEFKGYMDSVQAFAAKKVDGVTMTSMESLQPASNGVDSVAILVNDTSNGGDGVLVRPNLDLKGLKGKTILLEEFSVSHYLLVRALESAGLKEKDVKIKNIPGDEAGKAFLTDQKVDAVTTWNPHLFQATEQGKGKIVFSSKQIPGEIIDLLVVSGSALKESPKLGNALVEAWYDAMKMINDPTTRPEAIEIMAKAAGASVQDFNKMLADTDLYTDRQRAATFLESETIKQTMVKVKEFSFSHDLIKDNSFSIGYGAGAGEKLRVDASYVRASK